MSIEERHRRAREEPDVTPAFACGIASAMRNLHGRDPGECAVGRHAQTEIEIFEIQKKDPGEAPIAATLVRRQNMKLPLTIGMPFDGASRGRSRIS